MKKRGFLKKLLVLLPPFLAVASFSVSLLVWHTSGTHRIRKHADSDSRRGVNTTPSAFHECVPSLISRISAERNLNPKNIHSPKKNNPNISERNTYTVHIPFGESFSYLNLKLTQAVSDSGGMVFDAVENMEGDRFTVTIGAGSTITDTVVFKKSLSRRRQPIKTAIVVISTNDTDVPALRGLCQLNIPITFAVTPGKGGIREIAGIARDTGNQILIYASSGRENDAGKIVPSEPDDTIIKKLDDRFASIPEAKGILMSVQSRSDDDIRGLETIMEYLRKEHGFFIDLMPAAASAGCAVAGRRWVKSAGTEGVVDASFVSEKGRAGLRALIQSASEHVPSIIACTAEPAVTGLLVRELPVLRSSGYRFVGVDAIVR